MREAALLDTADYARLAVDVASDRQASDIVLLDIREVSDFADYFVIMTADSPRQMQDLAQEIGRAIKDSGSTLHHTEGTAAAGWVLMDAGDVIVHLFGPEEREYYDIEGAWSQAAEVVRIQ